MGVFVYNGEITIDGYSIGKKYYETTAVSKEKARSQIIWQVRIEYGITNQLWKKVELLEDPYLKPIVARNVVVPGDEKIDGGKQIGFDIPYPPDSEW